MTDNPSRVGTILDYLTFGGEWENFPRETSSIRWEHVNPEAGVNHPDMIAKRWPKGVSGNPRGRPCKKTMRECAQEVLAEKNSRSETGETNQEALARIIVEEAIASPNSQSAKMILDREWAAETNINLSGNLTHQAGNPYAGIDLSQLSDDELEVAKKLARIAEPDQVEAGGDDVEAYPQDG